MKRPPPDRRFPNTRPTTTTIAATLPRRATGLSYTTFTYGVSSEPAIAPLSVVNDYLAAHPRFGSAYAPLDAPAVGAYAVNVTNTGTIDADDVVLGFLVPPGAGTGGVALQVRRR